MPTFAVAEEVSAYVYRIVKFAGLGVSTLLPIRVAAGRSHICLATQSTQVRKQLAGA